MTSQEVNLIKLVRKIKNYGDILRFFIDLKIIPEISVFFSFENFKYNNKNIVKINRKGKQQKKSEMPKA